MQKVSDLEGWPWQPNLCPADDDFIDWLNYQVAEGKAEGPVFHMGTGLHHKVGLECIELGLSCVGITASEEEFNSDRDSAYEDGNGHYAIVFCNIYELSPVLLGEFQYMSLFHLGEMVDRFGDINYEAIDGLIGRVRPGGSVLFYAGSSAWDRAFYYIQHCVEDGILAPIGIHRSLAVCEKI